MPPFIFVCFTCTRDCELLPLHFQAIRRAVPGAPVYYVYEMDDGEHAVVPAGAIKVLASFPHNGNLLGLKCHLGMLDTMRQLSERNGGIPAIKIDSDVIFIKGDFLASLGKEHDMVGAAPARDYYCKGTCYGMTRTLISKVIAYLRKDYIDLSDRLEDSTISMVSALVSDAGKVKIHNAMSADRTDVLYCMFNNQLRQYPDVIRSIKGFIDCGDILYTRQYDNQTAAKHEAMSFVSQVLQQN